MNIKKKIGYIAVLSTVGMENTVYNMSNITTPSKMLIKSLEIPKSKNTMKMLSKVVNMSKMKESIDVK